MHLLHTVLYTFPEVLTWRICLIIMSFFSWWSFPLLSWSLCVIRGGEVRCLSLLGSQMVIKMLVTLPFVECGSFQETLRRFKENGKSFQVQFTVAFAIPDWALRFFSERQSLGTKRGETWKREARNFLLAAFSLPSQFQIWEAVNSMSWKFFLGAFLIPYVFSLVVMGIPLFFMELAIGQSLRQGSVGVWNAIHPFLGGLGFASVVICLLVGLYYNMIIAWCFYYLFASFQDPLPYANCPMVDNVTFVEECQLAGRTQYYWYRNALEISASIEESGGLLWHLCLVLLLSWIVVFLCMMRGVESAGKVSTVINILVFNHGLLVA